MRNRDEKKKDMQRSVLPSNGRKTARRKRRLIHKKTRSRQRDLLVEYAKDPYDTEPDFREGRRKAALYWMVADRRTADKTAPLTRWALRVVGADPALRNAPLHEQVAHFEALLPSDLIGKHAVGHIRWALEADRRFDPLWMVRLREGRGPTRDERLRQLRADIEWILDAGRHGDLNDALRVEYRRGASVALDGPVGLRRPARLLLGRHDAQAFAEDVVAYPYVCDAVRRVAEQAI